MRILFLVARQFQNLLLAKELRSQGYDSRAISARLGIPEFAARKHLAQSGNFTPKQLKKAVSDCVQAEEDVKTGNMNDRMAVEVLIVRLSAGEP